MIRDTPRKDENGVLNAVSSVGAEEADPGFGFKGTIGRTLQESTPWWPEPTRAPAGAPDVVMLAATHAGVAQVSLITGDPFGGPAATPITIEVW